MATFPTLNTGSVTQYPLGINTGQGAEVILFLDGTDQRYLTQARTLRQWQIRLELLNDEEMQQLEAFFIAQQGDYSTFDFPDPYSGALVPNCRFGAPGFISDCVGVDVNSTSLGVIETNG